jgi:O-antigen/teichoic acid export membrane protein
MIVVNFLIGIAIVAAIVGILYGIGTFTLRRSGEYDKNTDFIEIMLNGVLGLALIAICILVLFLIYALGEAVTNKLF